MALPSVGKCCYFIELRTGTLIIGYFFTLLAISELCLHTATISLRPYSSMSPQRFAFYLGLAILAFLQFFSGTLLIVGVYVRRALLLLPWTVLTSITVMGAFFFLLAVSGFLLQNTGTIQEDIIITVYYVVRSGLSMYSVVVVHSFHKRIMIEKQEARFHNSGRIYLPVSQRAPMVY